MSEPITVEVPTGVSYPQLTVHAESFEEFERIAAEHSAKPEYSWFDNATGWRHRTVQWVENGVRVQLHTPVGGEQP